MSLASMYTVPLPLNQRTPFCSSRHQLLSALTGGGRYGFDAPFAGRDCQFQWFPAQEICSILARFQSIAFVGDDIVKNIYMGLQVLLQEDFALGALKTWEMQEIDRGICSCGAQFSGLQGDGCSKFAIKSAAEIEYQKSNYLCSGKRP